ncbi:unnamed protein product, partial [Amoebophrya sp. A25]|eukprot:GSA25T00027546001.1
MTPAPKRQRRAAAGENPVDGSGGADNVPDEPGLQSLGAGNTGSLFSGEGSEVNGAGNMALDQPFSDSDDDADDVLSLGVVRGIFGVDDVGLSDPTACSSTSVPPVLNPSPQGEGIAGENAGAAGDSPFPANVPVQHDNTLPAPDMVDE